MNGNDAAIRTVVQPSESFERAIRCLQSISMGRDYLKEVFPSIVLAIERGESVTG
jgi:hypothetical protein